MMTRILRRAHKGHWAERAITDFLLNNLPESERAKIESKYFHNREYREQVLAMEQELILTYLRGELSAADRGRFEAGFLKSERRKALIEETRRLMSAADRSSPATGLLPVSQSPFAAFLNRYFKLRWAAAALLIGAVIYAGWFPSVGDEQIAQTPAEPATPAPSVRLVEPGPLPPRTQRQTTTPARRGKHSAPIAPTAIPPAPKTYDFSLDVAMTRDGNLNTTTAEINIPRDAEALNLTLKNIVPAYPSYRISLKSMEGQPVWKLDSVKSRRQEARLRIPAELIRDGEFVLDIYGLNGRKAQLSQSFLRVISQ
jgi:hypothetical protein